MFKEKPSLDTKKRKKFLVTIGLILVPVATSHFIFPLIASKEKIDWEVPTKIALLFITKGDAENKIDSFLLNSYF